MKLVSGKVKRSRDRAEPGGLEERKSEKEGTRRGQLLRFFVPFELQPDTKR